MHNVRIIQYRLGAPGWFVRLPQTAPFNGLPDQLLVEKTVTGTPRSNGADTIIRSVRKHPASGRYLFYTGLRKTPRPGWFSGDSFEVVSGVKFKSTCLFYFTADALEVHYFERFHVPNSKVRSLLSSYIPTLPSRQ